MKVSLSAPSVGFQKRALCPVKTCADQSSITGVRHHLTTKQQKTTSVWCLLRPCICSLLGHREGPCPGIRGTLFLPALLRPPPPPPPPPSLLSPSLLQCLRSTFLDNYIFGNGHSACCGANRRVNGLFPSTTSNRAVPSCYSAEVQATKGQGPCQGNRLWCEALLAQLLHGQ
ncbi:unnamed protein product [Rangifer tarandus platyrhynchus]|uniref:Uncharacterized protein n=1 Tax=Rangifer tarandus platyrhynchus TaxID=3082113 RepID=A0AC59YVZ0_RANTA